MKETTQIILAEFISVTGGILAGSLLAAYLNKLELIPGLIIFIPGFMEMMGGITGSLSARLSSALHVGSLKPEFKMQKELTENALATFISAILVGFILGIISMTVSYFIFKRFIIHIVVISVLASFISVLIEIFLVVYSEIFLFRRNLDPDNVMGPYITTLGDVVCIFSLLIAIMVIT